MNNGIADQRPGKKVLAQRLPFFYGWIMVANMFAAGMASSGPTLWGFSIFVHPMTDELGWSRGALFGALTAHLVGADGVAVASGSQCSRCLLASRSSIATGLGWVRYENCPDDVRQDRRRSLIGHIGVLKRVDRT